MTPTNSPYDSGSDATAELLRQALSAEASEVQPSRDALRSIQQRTGAASAPSADSSGRARRFRAGSTRTNRGGRRPSWILGALGAAAATAAVITAVVVIGDYDKPQSNGEPIATQPTTPGTPSPSQSTAPEELVKVPVTYVGLPGPARASRLYTGQEYIATTGSRAVEAVALFLHGEPPDPDYTTGWPKGIDVTGISTVGSVTQIDLEGPTDLQFTPDPDLGPDGGQLALQALLQTAGVQPGDQGKLTYNGDPLSAVFGVQLPATVQSDDEVRALISIDNLVDGQKVSNPVTVKVSGNVFEGTVNWELLDAKGTKVDDGVVTTSMGLWTRVDIELGNLDRGTYTIRCLDYSPEDGSPGNVDDKTFTVR